MSPADPDQPEPDCREGAPHPRQTARLFGQDAAEQEFLDAQASGRLHHAWLITGPEGIGKATLAWRAAQFLLTRPPRDGGGSGGLFGAAEPERPETLAVDPEHPVAQRIAALSEPGLFLLRRPWDADRKRLRKEITVDASRGLHRFFALSAADGGHRVVIVDAVDALNVNAANALLKLIEEPPPRCTLLMICHRPAGILPTIRSRCRLLRCAPLGPRDLAAALDQAGAELPDSPQDSARLAEMSGGSVGRAWDLLMLGGLKLDGEVRALIAGLPGHDRRAALRLAERLAPAAKAEERQLFYRLMLDEIAALARSGVDPAQAGERARIAPDVRAAQHWATAQTELGQRITHAEAVNLDPTSVILDMVRRIDEVAARTARRESEVR